MELRCRLGQHIFLPPRRKQSVGGGEMGGIPLSRCHYVMMPLSGTS